MHCAPVAFATDVLANRTASVTRVSPPQDAIVVSKASLDRGFGRCIVNHSYKGQLKRYINRTSDRIVAPAAAQRTGRYKALGADGLADVGTQIGPGVTPRQAPAALGTMASAQH